MVYKPSFKVPRTSVLVHSIGMKEWIVIIFVQPGFFHSVLFIMVLLERQNLLLYLKCFFFMLHRSGVSNDYVCLSLTKYCLFLVHCWIFWISAQSVVSARSQWVAHSEPRRTPTHIHIKGRTLYLHFPLLTVCVTLSVCNEVDPVGVLAIHSFDNGVTFHKK